MPWRGETARDRCAACHTCDGPLIVQLEDPGHSGMLEQLKGRLSPASGSKPAADGSDPRRDDRRTRRHAEHRRAEPWTVVEFDAWQHQRLAPPWWWLVDGIDEQIRQDLKPTPPANSWPHPPA
jgi:hypothetical protein